ncbi:MAG: transcription factor IIA subunit alpha [Pycnora praestabilis]|nr:MAG: transcription factor IIA subunit alpha [Pycnora praestabilis]
MSNQHVGQIYQRIIQDVISSSQVDFEEGGVDQQTLNELKEGWQRKLSSINVAQFPWEPAPVPTPMANTPTVPSNVTRPATQPAITVPPVAAPPSTPYPQTSGVRVKMEPSYEGGLSMPSIPQANGVSSMQAQQMAARNLQQKFGSQANTQINALQAGVALPGQQRPQGLQLPPQMTGQQVQQQYQQQQYQQQQQQQQRNGLNGAQTDGAGDAKDEWTAVICRRNAHGGDEQMGTATMDRMIRAQVEQMGQRLEGGGLMLPLDECRIPEKARKRKVKSSLSHSTAISTQAVPSSSDISTSYRNLKIAQYDGGDESDDDDKAGVKDEEEIDEDAINSDLDDSDEEQPKEGEEDDSTGQIMLCTYDKVQRVKNKWKCTLKDGVLTTGGKEYVFHKAQGEFEW